MCTNGQHDKGCPVAGWEQRALEALTETIRAAMLKAWTDEDEFYCAPPAIARAVWDEVCEAPIATGEHPARDLLAYYAVMGIGQQLVNPNLPHVPNTIAVLELHQLSAWFLANLDRLLLVNSTPEELARSH